MKRREAARAGLTRYTTGKPCKRGHLSERFTNGGECVECNRINASRPEARAKAVATTLAWKRAHRVERAEQVATKKCGAGARIKADRPKPEGCEVCGKPGGNGLPGNPKPLHFDHCHRTHAFRGWLCAGCNQALGLVNDNADTLRKLATYVDVAEVLNG